MVACYVLLGFFLIVNVVGYAMARSDKKVARSRRGGARIPEKAFHAVALFGGGLGTGAAFLMHRHKTRKVAFLVPFILAALVGTALSAAWAALLC